MKIVFDNGKEYNVAGVSGLTAIAHALLKEYGRLKHLSVPLQLPL